MSTLVSNHRHTRSIRLETMLIGVISDTHGLLRPEALVALQGSDRIIHAGDIGDPTILDRLSEIAPVTAVRGNVDRESWAKKYSRNQHSRSGWSFDLRPARPREARSEARSCRDCAR